jgi:hypothetical protein
VAVDTDTSAPVNTDIPEPPSGGGGIGGSTGAVGNAVLRADGAGGSTLQNSLVTIDDSGNILLASAQELRLRDANCAIWSSTSGIMRIKAATECRVMAGVFEVWDAAFARQAFAVQEVGSSINFLEISPSQAGAPLLLTALGEANIGINLVPKGTGDLQLGGVASSGTGGLVRATSPTLVTPSITGAMTLNENAAIALDPAGSADGKYSGITVTGTAGYTQAFGDLVYLDPTDSRWELCDANSAAEADGDSRGNVGMVVVAGTDGTACTILLKGIIRADAKFPAFTINNPIYVSETAGAVTQTRPTTAAVVVRVVGFALTADEMFFNPSASFVDASLTASGVVEFATTTEINTGTDTTRAIPVDQYVASNRNVRYFNIRCVEAATSMAVANVVGGDVEAPFAGTITEVGAYVDTAGTTNVSTIDINKNGTTILSTKVTIDSAEKSSRTAATPAVISVTSLAAGDIFTIDVDGISTTAPKGLTVRIGVRQT